jgi:SAM-dependent methyltransferase
MQESVSLEEPQSVPPRRRGPRYRLYAWLIAKWAAGIDHLIVERKRTLLSPLRGTVVEIGPGTGANLTFYSPDVRWIGIEPNGHMDAYLYEEARRLRRDVDVRGGTAEAIPLADETADAVVATMVLCSVENQERALSEILRVLKPGGSFVFMEHVAADKGSRLLQVQNVLNPGWRLFADGCNINRSTGDAIRQAGFRAVHLEQFEMPQGFASPHIAGYAKK